MNVLCLAGLLPAIALAWQGNAMCAVVSINGIVYHSTLNDVMRRIDIITNIIIATYVNIRTLHQPTTFLLTTIILGAWCLERKLQRHHVNHIVIQIIHVLFIQLIGTYCLYLYTCDSH